MKRGNHLALLAASLATAVRASVLSVADIASMYREEASEAPSCVVTGVVSCVFAWQKNAYALVDAADPNGLGIFVGSNLPGMDRLELADGEAPTVGDLVEVRGVVLPYMLEPGVHASQIRIVGQRTLPAPPLKRLADLELGTFNNRRMTVKGVLQSVRAETLANGPVTMMTLGTPDGVVRVHLRGEWPDLAVFRDREIAVDGVCVPSYNARAEFLRPEVEAVSREAIYAVQRSEAAVCLAPRGGVRPAGVMTWMPQEYDGHLRRLSGEVTYVNRAGRFFVLQAETSVRVDVEGDCLPEVGETVEAAGFPTMSDDCGILALGTFVRTGRNAGRRQPVDFTADELHAVMTHDDPGEMDCHYRLVRVRGRVLRAELTADGRTEFELEIGGHRLRARLESAAASLVEALVDRPLASVAGVLKVSFENNVNTGRGVTIQSLTLLMRDASDLVPEPDAESRRRGLVRLSRTAGLWSLLPLALLVVWVRLRAIRQRDRVAAVSADRRRLAEELHDTIAQHLSGARLLLFSVQNESDRLSEASRGALAMAGDILESARREMRDAILNLQSDEMMMRPPKDLLKILAAKANAAGGARVRTMLRGLPSDMSTAEKTDLIAFAQEAMTNAVKHGRAARILLVSDPLRGGGFAFSVLNDGEPFDAEAALGPETGHFGLSSMRERAARNGYALSFGRRNGWNAVRIERKKR